jgi:signal transduction histidine kinase
MTVSDRGIAISAEGLPLLFEPFVHDARARRRFQRSRAWAFGLTVVRKLAEAHGGNVVAHSAGDGLGSRFVMTLPLTGRRGPQSEAGGCLSRA